MNKKIENIGFIIDKTHFNKYQKIFEYSSFEESISEYNHHKFKQIDFLKKDYLKSDLYKPGNILLIPYNSSDFGWYLSPWQILSTKNGTKLNCKHVLFEKCFDKNENIWKYSSIRKYLNSKTFLNRFPEYIQKNIGFHDIWTDQEITSDRFWLLSIYELGIFGKNYITQNKFRTYDYPGIHKAYNSKIFRNGIDLKKFYGSDECSWMLRSSIEHTITVTNYYTTLDNDYLFYPVERKSCIKNYKTCNDMYLVYTDDSCYFNIEINDSQKEFGCAPTFILQ